MGEEKNAYRVLLGKPRGRDRLEDLDLEVRIILK
jgi:hypothetical protein